MAVAEPLIAVTGATGQVGGGVARRLAARRVPQRLVVRDQSRAPRLEGAEVAEVAGYHVHDEMRSALEGCEAMLLISAAEAVDRVEQHRTAVDAAVAAGVRRIVYVSFVNASPDAAFTLVRHHWATEEHIRASGTAFTFLRMNLYLDFLPSMVGADGVIRGPAGDGRAGVVLRDEVSAVAAAVLTGDGHEGQTYDVTGPESLSLAGAAAIMARLSGKRITFHDETVEEAYESRRQFGAPEWEVEGWVSSYLGLAAGELDVVSDTVARITGKPATSLADYVGENPESLAHMHP